MVVLSLQVYTPNLDFLRFILQIPDKDKSLSNCFTSYKSQLLCKNQTFEKRESFYALSDRLGCIVVLAIQS